MIENLTRGLLRTEKALRRWDATNQNSIPHGWLADTATWTYASASTFTVAGDRTDEFTEGLYIKLTQSATVAYFWVVSSAYDGSTNTTVTVQGTDLESPATLASAAISATYLWVSSVDAPSGYVLKAAGTDGPVWEEASAGPLADHDHSGDAGDGGTFDAANLTSGEATDGQVLTSDGSAGAAWESLPAESGKAKVSNTDPVACYLYDKIGGGTGINVSSQSDVELSCGTGQALTITLDSHGSSHEDGGTDEIDAADLGSGSADDGKVLTADGSGGAAWESIPGATEGWTWGQWSSTSWDGDAKSGASGIIDLSAVFGLPAGIKAVSLRLTIKDGAAGTYAILSQSSTNNQGSIIARVPVNNLYSDAAGVIPCDANGDIYFSQSAVEIDNVYLYINGYLS